MGFFEDVGWYFSGMPRRGPASESHPDGEVLTASNQIYDTQHGVLSAENIENTGLYIKDTTVEYADWCKNNPLQCALATADFIPIVGTAARCGQFAVQGLIMDDVGEETQFNCELNAAGDLIPVVGKELAVGAKAALRGGSKVARGTASAMTLRLARTKVAEEGLSQAEKEAALMELGRASEDYTKTVARETEKFADEALEMEANNAARLAAEEESEFIAFAEKRAAEMEERAAIKATRDAEVGGMIKEARAASKLQAKFRARAAAKLAEKAEADAADHAAMRRGASENAAKDAKPKPKPFLPKTRARFKALAKPIAKRTVASDVAMLFAEPVLAVLHCEPDPLAGDGAGMFGIHHDGPALYTHNPLCPAKTPCPAKMHLDSDGLCVDDDDDDDDDIIPTPPPWENDTPLHPDLWLSLARPTTAREAGYDPSSIYLVGGVLVLVAAGAYAYYKF